jgi:hypothetical protein
MAPMDYIDSIDHDIAYHMACHEGFSPKATFEAEVAAGEQEHKAEQAEIEGQLEERLQKIKSTLSALIQEEKQNDSNKAARKQLKNLSLSLESSKGTRENLLKVLKVADAHMSELRIQNIALQSKLEGLGKTHKQKAANDPFAAFVVKAGHRACEHYVTK